MGWALLVVVLAVGFFVAKIQRKLAWLSTVVVTNSNLARSLDEHRQLQECRGYLSSLLGLDLAALPPLGLWSASSDVLLLLAEQVLRNKPRTVVEFGCGASTIVLAKALSMASPEARLLSFEHDAEFAALTTVRAERLGLKVHVEVARLVPAERVGYAGLWYDVALPDHIDLLFIDGPPNALHLETRDGAASAFKHLSDEALIVLDDAAREGERAIAARWRSAFPGITFTYMDTAKGVLLGRKSSQAQTALSPRDK